MKRLLIITRWYLPATKSGGTVRSIVGLVNGLKDDFKITILTSNRDLGATEPYKDIEFDTFLSKNGISIVYLSKLSLFNIYKYMKSAEYDIVYINSFFDIMTQSIMLLKSFKLIDKRIVLAPRGELANGALSIKATKKKIYLILYKLFNLSKNIIFHSTSKEDSVDIQNMFPSNRIELIQNIKERSQESYILPHKEINNLKIVFISRIVPVKNLLYGLEIFQKNRIDGTIIFDIYGPNEDENYWHECKKVIEKLPDNIKVSYKGFVNPDIIDKTLSNYHLFFLPTKGENFGHAIVEAMQVGLIPLISDKTPWTNLESIDVGFSLKLKEPDAFWESIKKVLLFDNSEFLQWSENVKKYISKKVNRDKTIEEYRDFFIKLTDKSI